MVRSGFPPNHRPERQSLFPGFLSSAYNRVSNELARGIRCLAWATAGVGGFGLPRKDQWRAANDPPSASRRRGSVATELSAPTAPEPRSFISARLVFSFKHVI